MSTSDDYALVYDFSTLGTFANPHPRNNLKDLPVVACSLAYKEPAEVERVVNQTWKRNFVAFYEGKESDTQAYIFTDAVSNANLIVLVFRGSDSVSDWMHNVSMLQLPLGQSRGAVHFGFWFALSRPDEVMTVYKPGNQQESKTGPAFDTIRETLAGLELKHPKAKILVTGHSLGGALALIFTLKLSLQPRAVTDSASYKLLTFGQPKVGDSTFCSYTNKLELNYTRVVNDKDIVPDVPPTLPFRLGYYHGGTLLHYFKDGTENVERQLRGIAQPYFADHAIEAYVRRTKESLDQGKPEWLWRSLSLEDELDEILALAKRMNDELPKEHVVDDSHSAVTPQPKEEEVPENDINKATSPLL